MILEDLEKEREAKAMAGDAVGYDFSPVRDMQGDPISPATAQVDALERKRRDLQMAKAQHQPATQVSDDELAAEQAIANAQPYSAGAPVAAPSIPVVGGGGGGGITRAANAITGESRRYAKDIKGVADQQLGALRDVADARIEQSRIAGELANQQFLIRQQEEKRLQDIRQRKQEAYSSAQADISRRVKEAETTLEPAEYDKFVRMSKNTALPARDRDWARARLKRAENVDPMRVLGGSGNKVLAGIAIALGGIAAGLRGDGKNTALEIITNAIDRDVESQREGMRRRRQSAIEAQDRLKESMGLFDEEEQDAIAMTVRKLDAAAAKIGQQMEMAKGAEQKATLTQLQADVIGKKTELIHNASSKAAETAADLAVKEEQLGLQRDRFGVERYEAAQKSSQSARELMVPGLSGQAINSQAQTKVMAKKAEIDEIKAKVGRLKNIVDSVGAEVFPTNIAEKAKAMATEIQLLLGKGYGLGALSKEDLEMVGNIMSSDPTRWRTSVVKAQLDNLDASMTESADKFYGAHMIGYQPAVAPRNGGYDPAFKPRTADR